MRVARAALIVLSTLGAGAALADEPADIADVLQAAKPARDAWERCAANAAKPSLRGDRPAETVAQLALDACKRAETALRDTLRKEIGPERAALVTSELRTIYRANLVKAIEQLRRR
ncbi:MAG TPA: hypothetical protein VEA41_01655 [Salinarimonas sp.]|jgi:hypothetical protein|nr:hypothetical protein [Salinarimonas sp.]